MKSGSSSTQYPPASVDRPLKEEPGQSSGHHKHHHNHNHHQSHSKDHRSHKQSTGMFRFLSQLLLYLKKGGFCKYYQSILLRAFFQCP